MSVGVNCDNCMLTLSSIPESLAGHASDMNLSMSPESLRAGFPGRVLEQRRSVSEEFSTTASADAIAALLLQIRCKSDLQLSVAVLQV
jgi:hypothetical protein